MVVHDAQPHAVLTCPQGQDHIEDNIPRHGLYPDLAAVQIVPDLRLLPFGDGGDDLQNFPRVTGHRARRGCGGDALESAGIGDHYALDVFDDIPAGFHQHPLRQMSQHLPGFCRAVGDGDGLRTAHRRDQLLPEDLNKVPVAGVGFFHNSSPSQEFIVAIIAAANAAPTFSDGPISKTRPA